MAGHLFKEAGLTAGCSLSDDGVEQAGMGVAVGDANLDIFPLPRLRKITRGVFSG
jgi:hypothetical protein